MPAGDAAHGLDRHGCRVAARVIRQQTLGPESQRVELGVDRLPAVGVEIPGTSGARGQCKGGHSRQNILVFHPVQNKLLQNCLTLQPDSQGRGGE